MKRILFLLLSACLLGGNLLGADAHADNAKSLFVNVSSGRPHRVLVAMMVAQANQFFESANVTLFLADQAAPYSVKTECLAKRYDDDKLDPDAIEQLQFAEPFDLGDGVPALDELVAAGATVLGCPICVAEAIDPMKCDPIFNELGQLDMDAWGAAVVLGIQPINPNPETNPSGTGDFNRLYGPQAAVISF